MIIFTVIATYVDYDSVSPYDYSSQTLEAFSTEELASKYASEMLYINGTEDDYCYKRSYHVSPMKVCEPIADARTV